MDDRGAPKLSPRAVAWVRRLTDAGIARAAGWRGARPGS